MRFIQYKLADNAVADLDFYSDPVDVSSAVAVAIQAHVASGTVKGKAFIQVSLDPINTTPSNFVTIGSGADLTGSATTAVERVDICANWVRLYWDHTSSTGTLDVHLKTIGY